MVEISVFDTFPIIVGFLALCIAATVIVHVYQVYLGSVVQTGLMPVNSTQYNATVKVGNIFNSVDPLLQMVFIILMIATIVGATMLNSNPVGYAIGFVFLLFFIYASAVISNVGLKIFSNPQLSFTAANTIPSSLHILATLPEYQIFFMFLYLIIIAGRNIFFNQQQPQQLPQE